MKVTFALDKSKFGPINDEAEDQAEVLTGIGLLGLIQRDRKVAREKRKLNDFQLCL